MHLHAGLGRLTNVKSINRISQRPICVHRLRTEQYPQSPAQRRCFAQLRYYALAYGIGLGPLFEFLRRRISSSVPYRMQKFSASSGEKQIPSSTFEMLRSAVLAQATSSANISSSRWHDPLGLSRIHVSMRRYRTVLPILSDQHNLCSPYRMRFIDALIETNRFRPFARETHLALKRRPSVSCTT